MPWIKIFSSKIILFAFIKYILHVSKENPES
jgi:hypothetical protein